MISELINILAMAFLLKSVCKDKKERTRKMILFFVCGLLIIFAWVVQELRRIKKTLEQLVEATEFLGNKKFPERKIY